MTRGERIIAFIEKYAVTPEAKHVGKPLKLADFQKEFILAIFDAPAPVRRAYLSISRKNGKSALIAAILLAFIVGPEAVRNSQIISGGMSRDQASLVFELARRMVSLSPELSKLCKITPSKKMITGLAMNVEYKAISAEAGTAHGLSPVLAILDEVGQIKGPHSPFVEAIETSQGAHENPLLIAISTQAATDGDLFSTWIDDAASSGDPGIVSHVYSAPKGCDLDDLEAWRASNPALGLFRSEDDLREFAKQAARLPSKEASFRWLYLNQRVEANSPYLSRAEWEASAEPPDWNHSGDAWGGLDLSQNRDLTAFVVVAPRDGKYDVYPHFWLPRDGIRERSRDDRVPYDQWAEMGYISLIEGPVIRPEVVAREVADICERFNLRALSYDRWRIEGFKLQLSDMGLSLPLVPFGQGYKDMAPALDKLENMVALRQLRHGGNPVMNMCADNSVATFDPAGNRKLDKRKTTARIDGLVALAMAVGGMDHEVDSKGPSYLESAGLMVL